MTTSPPCLHGRLRPLALLSRGAWLLVIAALSGCTGEPPADRVLLGGRVEHLAGPTVMPGLVDAHVHIANLGARLEQVDLVGVSREEEAVDRVAERAAAVPAGDWILGWGWDEGAWADPYPDLELLSERVPENPVLLRGLHSFAVWGNRLALERAGIDATTPDPPGGWYPEQRMSAEEARRGYTVWAAYTEFEEDHTVMDLDPLAVGETVPARLLEGRVVLPVVGGETVFDGR